MAAFVRFNLPQILTKSVLLARQGEDGRYTLHLKAKLSFEGLPELVGLIKQETGIESKNLNRQSELRQEVHQHHPRSEEHTSKLHSLVHLVCRLLLEKK